MANSTKKIYTEEYIQNIANAIRGKGVEGSFKVSEMADAVQSISGGGGDESLIAFLTDADQDTFHIPGEGPYTLDKYGVACGKYTTLDFTNIKSFPIFSVFGISPTMNTVEHLKLGTWLSLGSLAGTSVSDWTSGTFNVVSFFPNIKTFEGVLSRTSSMGWIYEFANCQKLEKIDLSQDYTFSSFGNEGPRIKNCPNLKEILFSSTLMGIYAPYIDEGTRESFPGCTSLESITLPFRGTCTMGGAFTLPTSLKTIYVNDDYVSNYISKYGSTFPTITFKPISEKPQ